MVDIFRKPERDCEMEDCADEAEVPPEVGPILIPTETFCKQIFDKEINNAL